MKIVKKNIQRVALFGNQRSESIKELMMLVISFLRKKEIEIVLCDEFYCFLFEKESTDFSDIGRIKDTNFDADLALSIGGDGTFLQTASKVGAKNIPILGINAGRLGFLADVSKDEVFSSLESIFNDEFRLEERNILQVEIFDETSSINKFALNDLAIQKQDSSSMIIINASYRGEMINSYQADGLIIATPTGSTAYSMSAGGPIVVPEVENFLITPVASHSLNVRPLVVPNGWIIDLEVVSRSNSYLISIDGHSKIVQQSTKVRVKKAEHTIKVVKAKNHTFFNTLRNKLLWGLDVRNK